METSIEVGVIGLGAMGRGMANNLIARGFSVVVREVLPEIVAQFTRKGAVYATIVGVARYSTSLP